MFVENNDIPPPYGPGPPLRSAGQVICGVEYYAHVLSEIRFPFAACWLLIPISCALRVRASASAVSSNSTELTIYVNSWCNCIYTQSQFISRARVSSLQCDFQPEACRSKYRSRNRSESKSLSKPQHAILARLVPLLPFPKHQIP